MDKNFNDKFDKCIRDVVGTSKIVENISEVDSITYVEIIVHLQNSFKVKFDASDFANLRTLQSVREKLLQLVR